MLGQRTVNLDVAGAARRAAVHVVSEIEEPLSLQLRLTVCEAVCTPVPLSVIVPGEPDAYL